MHIGHFLGGWWKIVEEVDLKGGEHVSFECGSGNSCYLSAMDNGRFTIGLPHPDGEEPNPEEIFAVVKTPDDPKTSFKTGYGKYIGVDSNGALVATAEAQSPLDHFQGIEMCKPIRKPS
ncbi:FRG1-like family protein, partial [Ostertagia ostertagi]